jgi:hypothetical protein
MKNLKERAQLVGIGVLLFDPTFCFILILLFNSVGCVFLLLCLCILIVMYALFCTFCFHRTNWHSPATLTEFFRAFSSVVRQMRGYTSQRRGTARTLPN